jgi:hypothetical protein
MNHPTIGHAITTAVRVALAARRDRLDVAHLVVQSDALLATLARGHGAPVATTAALLGRYDTRLHQELCQGTPPRMTPATAEAELWELTRAVFLTIGLTEGVSMDVAVSLALVLYARGVAPFCATPTLRPRTA